MTDDVIKHVGVTGMHWGHRKAQTPLQKLKKQARPFSMKEKVGIVSAYTAGFFLTPAYMGIPLIAATAVYTSHRASTMYQAQKALKKLGKKKASSLPKMPKPPTEQPTSSAG